ncbi:MAG: sigma-70 family RNA polymerase sigma factor, partial [Clostridia bacterium]|nr:sigma-70 family RNA polymerase sigma factor [Clostridia bacterium]
LMDLWNSVPPDRPKRVLAYVSALVRRRAIDRVRYKTASRRGGEEYDGSLDELAECLADPDGESVTEAVAIRDCLQRFVYTLSEEDRIIFTLRYFSFMSGEEIGEACGLRGSAVVMRLVRIRKKLKKALEHDGIYI